MNAIHAIQGTIALLILGGFLIGPWQWVITDRARQRMFSARDEIFDIARAGLIEFDSVEYRDIRDQINNMIRFSHDLHWTRLLLLATASRQPIDKTAPIYQAMNNITKKDTREKIKSIVNTVEIAAVQMLFLKSPILILILTIAILPAVIFFVAFFFARNFLREITYEIGKLIQVEAALMR